jgi:hypothetical protein
LCWVRNGLAPLSSPRPPLLGVMRDVLDGQAPRDADRHHAEGVLRMLGVTAEDAREVARRPLPKLPEI